MRPERDLQRTWGSLWHTQFTLQLPDLLLPLGIQEGRTRDPAARLRGRDRPGDAACTLKLSLDGCGRCRDAAGDHDLPAGSAVLFARNDPAFEHWFDPTHWHYIRLTFAGGLATVSTILRHTARVVELPNIGVLARRLRGYHRGFFHLHRPTIGEGLRLVGDALAAFSDAGERRDPATQLLCRAQALITVRLHARLRVGDLADELGLSAAHLSRLFRRELGIAPLAYIRSLLMHQACELLSDPGLDVLEVATQLGYRSSSHFCRLFRQELGTSPTGYRRLGCPPLASPPANADPHHQPSTGHPGGRAGRR